MFATSSRASLLSLPDPVREPAFYRGVAGKRGIAWLLDEAIIFALCLLALPFTAFTALFWWPVLWLMIGGAYRWATMASGSGTWGMRLLAIQIRDRDGARLDPVTAGLHVGGYLVGMTVLPLQIISAALIAGLGRGQGLTDLLLGTASINRPA